MLTMTGPTYFMFGSAFINVPAGQERSACSVIAPIPPQLGLKPLYGTLVEAN
jgi:hypothetical protein